MILLGFLEQVDGRVTVPRFQSSHISSYSTFSLSDIISQHSA